ncbi:MAG: sterol desaturase family protein [Pseudomonadota bacterium]
MASEIAVWKIAVTGGVFLVLFTAERLAPSVSHKQTGRLIRNAGLWLIILFASPLIIAPLTAIGANAIVWERPDSLKAGSVGALILIVDLVLLDLWTYGLHRAYHRIPVMWRLHEVHHRDEHLDTTSALRFHLGEVTLSALLRLAPIALLAIPLSTVIIFEALLLCAALFHHSNIRLPASIEKALSRVIVTPSIHWIHHHAIRSDTDSNYASILSLWDLIFRSRSQTQRYEAMKIGVEDRMDVSLHKLLILPFKSTETS